MDCSKRKSRWSHRLVGDPVDVVTGANTDVTLDFQLAGPIPLYWQRYYNSGRNDRLRPLGWGHTHRYDHRLQFNKDGITYTDPSGALTFFDPLPADGDSENREGLTLRRVDSRIYRIHSFHIPAMEFEFDKDGIFASLIRLGRDEQSIEFQYGSGGHLETIIDSLNRVIFVEHDEEGRVLHLDLQRTEQDEFHPLITYQYDETGNLIGGIDAHGHRFSFAYDRNRRMLSKTDKRGYTFRFEYDDTGRCVHSRGEDGLHEVRLSYNPAKGETVVTRANGGKWKYLYDENGTITRIVDPYGGVQRFDLDDQGRVIQETDPIGTITKWLYDETGEFLGKQHAVDEFILDLEDFEIGRENLRFPETPREWEFGSLSFEGSKAGAVNSGHSLGGVPSFLLPHIREQSGADHKADLDIPDCRKAYTLQETISAEGLIFDDSELLTEQKMGEKSRRWLYDENGNVCQYTDYEGSTYMIEYSSWNLQTRFVDALGQSVTVEYGPTEQIKKVTDEEGNQTEYEYDLKDRLTRVRRYGRIRESYRYDPADHIVEKLDGNGRALITWEYDHNGLSIVRRLASGERHDFSYDRHGRIVHACTDDVEISLGFDQLGNYVKDQRNGLGIQNQYSGSRVQKSILFDSFTVCYDYDEEGNCLIEDPGGETHKISQFDKGLIMKELSNGTSEISQYDTRGRCLLKLLFNRQSHEIIRSIKYWYSAEGDLTRQEDSHDGTRNYSYDAAHRINATVNQGRRKHRISYDACGNVLNKPGLRKAIYRQGNLLEWADGEKFEYDGRNNIVCRRGQNATVVYSYDSLDTLVSVAVNGNEWNYRYDPLGRRISKFSNGHQRQFYWDSNRLAAEIGRNGRLRIYIYPDGDAIVPFMYMEFEGLNSDPTKGKSYFILCNQIGTPIMVHDSARKSVWEAELEPYGTTHIDVDSSVDLPLRFPGHYFDAETGLHYNFYRYYDPKLGRYIQSDPLDLGSGINVYAYEDNPLINVDLFGLGCRLSKLFSKMKNSLRYKLEPIGDFFGEMKWFHKPWREAVFPSTSLFRMAKRIIRKSAALKELRTRFSTGAIFSNKEAIRNTYYQFKKKILKKHGIDVREVRESDMDYAELKNKRLRPGNAILIDNDTIGVLASEVQDNPHAALRDVGHEVGAIELNRQVLKRKDISSGSPGGDEFREYIPRDSIGNALTHAIDDVVMGENRDPN